MQPSEKLVQHIRNSEGLRLVAYKPKGEKATGANLTIGYGHFGARAGQSISVEEAEEMLRLDLHHIAQQIDSLGLRLTQGQFDALCDFVFNLGFNALRCSSLLKKIRQNAPADEIAAEFRRWVYSGQKRLKGLEKRREWEIHCFFS